MTAGRHTHLQLAIVAKQMGRVPRDPWRVASTCRYGFPMTIVSPCRLADGTPFPDYAWLTCPHLVDAASAEESRGACAEWAVRASREAPIESALRSTDEAVRAARAGESGGVDECSAVGAAGQRDPLGVKCVHAHVALQLSGIDDVIGEWLIEAYGDACPDERCKALSNAGENKESE